MRKFELFVLGAALLFSTFAATSPLSAATCNCGGTAYPCSTTIACDPGGLYVKAHGGAAPKCDWTCTAGSCPDLSTCLGGLTIMQLCDRNLDGLCVICGTNVVATANTIYGTSVPDLICGLKGQDTIYGYDGDDAIDGGNENDTIYPGNGNDYVDAGVGNDIVTEALPGEDTLIGGDGEDCLYGAGGADFLDGGAGNDFVSAGIPGDDWFSGPARYDNVAPFGPRLCGGAGNDFLWDNENGGGCMDAGNGQSLPVPSNACAPLAFTGYVYPYYDCGSYAPVTVGSDDIAQRNCSAFFEAGVYTGHTLNGISMDCGCRE